MTFYSISYSDPAQVASTEALDSAIASVTEKFVGRVDGGFAAFEGPSAAFGVSPCAAGLLIKLPDGTCDIHPSPAGHLLLAQAIEDVAGARAPSNRTHREFRGRRARSGGRDVPSGHPQEKGRATCQRSSGRRWPFRCRWSI